MTKAKSRPIVIKMRPKKLAPGRPRKDIILKDNELKNTVGLTAFFQPTDQDMLDELSRIDSFAYSRSNSSSYETGL
jgi:hypothetical protein